MHVSFGSLKTLMLECSNESPGHHTARGGTSHARRAAGLAETAGAERWESSESASRSSREVPKIEQHVTTVLLYENRRFDSRCGKNEKYSDHQTHNSNAMG